MTRYLVQVVGSLVFILAILSGISACSVSTPPLEPPDRSTTITDDSGVRAELVGDFVCPDTAELSSIVGADLRPNESQISESCRLDGGADLSDGISVFIQRLQGQSIDDFRALNLPTAGCKVNNAARIAGREAATADCEVRLALTAAAAIEASSEDVYNVIIQASPGRGISGDELAVMVTTIVESFAAA